MIDLDAIRERDAQAYIALGEERVTFPEILFPKDGPISDRRALLRYVDELQEVIVQVGRGREAVWQQRDELLAAARKVTCKTCGGNGQQTMLDEYGRYGGERPCPDCSDLRALLAKEESHELRDSI